jgi:hypothetical protein
MKPDGEISSWLPDATFFALALEHPVVDMFVIPTAMISAPAALPPDAALACGWCAPARRSLRKTPTARQPG